MSDAMKIKAIAPWFGGKRTLAPRIVAELGPHTQYFEPFCGSMAVLLAKQPAQKETANDMHGDLMNLARVIADPHLAPVLYERLAVAPMCEALLEDARQVIESSSDDAEPRDVDRAFWYFLASWQGRNGTAGTARMDYQIAVRWTKNGGSPTVRFRNAVQSIPVWHARLLNVVMLCCDAFKFIDRFEDCPGTAIYVDSPYTAETRNNLGGKNGGGGRYKHEFTNRGVNMPQRGGMFEGDAEDRDDHERLAAALRGYSKARIVVSYYDCPKVRDLYPGWTVVDCATNKQLHQQNGRGRRSAIAPEILLINGPSLTAGGPAA